MKPTVAVALSGGVDSLVAAFLLKSQGHPVLGLHFVTGFEAASLAAAPGAPSAPLSPNPAIADLGVQLGIPVRIVDLRIEFRRVVVDYFTATYAAGRTPNPCLVCNPAIKFGVLMDHARRQGAQRLATGHYARLRQDDRGRFHLLKGVDAVKDQSYFLAFLSQEQLARTHFPLGELTKTRVRAIASEHRLRPVAFGESQDVCFIRDGSYADFLATRAGFVSQPGPIVDTSGRRLGTHPGLHRFTVGQRRGINCPAADPYYVLRLEPAENRLVVGSKAELARRECRVEAVHWIHPPPEGPQPVSVRLRYRHQAVPARLFPEAGHTARLRFDVPQMAVTPGQGAVFYRADHVLGAGWILGDSQ